MILPSIYVGRNRNRNWKESDFFFYRFRFQTLDTDHTPITHVSFPGPEYGTTEASWRGVLTEAERVSELHIQVKDRLMNEVHTNIKQWQKEHYHKSVMGPSKEFKDLDDQFRKVGLSVCLVETQIPLSLTSPSWDPARSSRTSMISLER